MNIVGRCGSTSLVVLFCLAAVCQGGHAAIISAASCSDVAVQAAIDSASSGDTVAVPGGSCTWFSPVIVPGTKGIIVKGGGSTIIANANLQINSNGATGTEVTGFTFAGSYTIPTRPAVSTQGCGGLVDCGGVITAPYRIDHNVFTDSNPADSSVFITVQGNGPGLIDHNAFTGGGASEMIHNLGMTPGDSSGWTDQVVPGSAYQVYIETNTFTYNATGNPAYAFGTSAVQSYYGARTVFRYNVCNMCQVDQHGSPGEVWTRWWEIYDNTFNTDVPNASEGTYIVLRGGSGVVFGNVHVGADQSTPSINLQVECDSAGNQCTTGYPQPYQIGRGINENLSPAYFWNNINQSDGSQMAVVSLSALAQLNRDYYASLSQPSILLRQETSTDTSSTAYAYVPFTYPYPLDCNGLPSTSPQPHLPADRHRGIWLDLWDPCVIWVKVF